MVAHEVTNFKRPRMKHLAVLPSHEPASSIAQENISHANFHHYTPAPAHRWHRPRHQRGAVAQVLDDGCPVGKPIRFRLTPADLKRFITALKAGVSDEVPITAVMEPTGMAWFPVATWLQRAGVRVIRVQGQRVKARRKYLSEHTKSDSVDAHVLGALPGFGGRGLDAVYVPGPEQHALQRLTKQRHRYQDLVCSARRRVRSRMASAS
jgi:transposase